MIQIDHTIVYEIIFHFLKISFNSVPPPTSTAMPLPVVVILFMTSYIQHVVDGATTTQYFTMLTVRLLQSIEGLKMEITNKVLNFTKKISESGDVNKKYLHSWE